MPVTAVDDHAEQYSGDKKLSAPNWPPSHAAVITPSDTDDLAKPSLWVVCSVDMTLKVETWGGETVTVPFFKGWNFARVKRIWSTGSTTNGGTITSWC
jgi:hypothetical protein